MRPKFQDSLVAETFYSYPPEFTNILLIIRQLIFEVAKENQAIGDIEENLKWGEPSYRPIDKKVGTSIRLTWNKNKPNQCGMYVHCQTNLIEQYKTLFDDMFKYEGKRAIVFFSKEGIPILPIKECIRMALMYHLNKK